MEQLNLTESLRQAPKIRDRLKDHYGLDVAKCYQCGKCTAGCPAAFAMDYTPRQIVRLLQLGLEEEALKSKTIWVCATCDTCSTRCPREVDPTKLMENLRIEAKKRGLVADKSNNLFNDLFLMLVRWFGRAPEFNLMVLHNLFTFKPFKDAQLGPAMLLKGKLHLFPKKIKDNGEVKRIFEKTRALGGEKK